MCPFFSMVEICGIHYFTSLFKLAVPIAHLFPPETARSRRGGGCVEKGGDACVALVGVTIYSPFLLEPTQEPLQFPTKRSRHCDDYLLKYNHMPSYISIPPWKPTQWRPIHEFTQNNPINRRCRFIGPRDLPAIRSTVGADLSALGGLPAIQSTVGADLSRTPPIYRPTEAYPISRCNN